MAGSIRRSAWVPRSLPLLCQCLYFRRKRCKNHVPGTDDPLLCSSHPIGGERVEVARPDTPVFDQAGIREHPKVLADGRATDR